MFELVIVVIVLLLVAVGIMVYNGFSDYINKK